MTATVRITNESPADCDVIVDTLHQGESRIGIEHRLEPGESVTEAVGAGEEIRVRTL